MDSNSIKRWSCYSKCKNCRDKQVIAESSYLEDLELVRGFQKKQYQLAAQKRHEADLKFNYFKQTVKFFERESEIAKHFNSWNLNQKSPYLEKTCKVEKLQERQNKLRSILKNEDEEYEKELRELKSKRNPSQDYSIEALKQKLKEKKAEQSLYLPRDCRRVQSYFYNTRNCYPLNNNLQTSRRSTNSKMSIKDTCPWSISPRSTSPTESTHHLEGAGKSTGVLSEPYFMNLERHQTGHNSQLLGTGMKELLHQEGHQEPDPKYSARYSRRSMEQTNLRGRGEDHNPYNYRSQDSPVNSPERKSASVSPTNLDEVDYQREIDNNPEDDNVENGTIHENDKVHEKELNEELLNISLREIAASEAADDNAKQIAAKKVQDLENAREKISCENYERERSLPWMRDGPREQNLSVQMFRYLAHNDLKRQILDLGQRELLACRKQWWSQALRLRDMRNRLELMREKNLYNTLDLHLDEESKQIGLTSIKLRENRVTEREEVCKNSSIYDEDAKDIWKKWVLEDEDITKLNPSEQRELLLNQLEEEWKNLAVKDKDRVSDLYQNIISKSEMQDEHKLSEAIRAAAVANTADSD